MNTYDQILNEVNNDQTDMFKFLRDLLAIPSESGDEAAVILRVQEEMIQVGFDEVMIDPMGNIHGRMGHGDTLIAMDAHMDTVGVGQLDNWTFDPYLGYEDTHTIGGRGASDQTGGMAAMVYGAKAMKNLNLLEGISLLITGTVLEEDCDGLCWQYIIETLNIRPDFVVITEPTSLNIYRGQRGRMEIKVETFGVSCHGSAPERGDNAIYKMAPILSALEDLNHHLKYDTFLGAGTLTVSEIMSGSPSRCAVSDHCVISIDRRLTDGETPESAVAEIRALEAVQQADAKVSIYDYERPAYTGLVYPTQSFFPTWVLPEDHAVTSCLAAAFENLFHKKPLIDKWTFSTNGVAIMGRYNIPCIGFGPGHEDEAHAPDEKTWKMELIHAAAMYAAIPMTYMMQKEA